jgi:hypothetical protein
VVTRFWITRRGASRTALLLHETAMRVIGVDVLQDAVDPTHRGFPYLKLGHRCFTAIGAPDNLFEHILMSHNSPDHAHPEEECVRVLREFACLRPGRTRPLSGHNLKSMQCSAIYLDYVPGGAGGL